MQIQNLVLFAALFAIGCGEKTDDERLDALQEACESIQVAAGEFTLQCGFDSVDFECESRRNLTEKHGCIDEAEALLGCIEGVGYDSLECDDERAGAGSACLDNEGVTWNSCVGI